MFCTQWHCQYEYKKVSAPWKRNDRFNARARETPHRRDELLKVCVAPPPVIVPNLKLTGNNDRDGGDSDFRGKSSRYTKMSRKFRQFPISPHDDDEAEATT